MKTEHIAIKFFDKSPSGKTGIYEVKANRNQALLGYVKWFGRWRQYTFFPERETVFNPVCMREIADFCQYATERHRTFGLEKS